MIEILDIDCCFVYFFIYIIPVVFTFFKSNEKAFFFFDLCPDNYISEDFQYSNTLNHMYIRKKLLQEFSFLFIIFCLI